MFQEIATTPITLEASRYCDLISRIPNGTVEGRGVEQAYLLARTVETHKTKCLVVLLERALDVHPLAGAFWQKYCNEDWLDAGFPLFSDNWPCTYWNNISKTLLCVYVDDMRMVGKPANLEKHWVDRRIVVLARPPGNDARVSTFIGCEHTRFELHVRCTTWDVIVGLRRALNKYIAGVEMATNMIPRCTPRMFRCTTSRRNVRRIE